MTGLVRRPLVVATVHTPRGLRMAAKSAAADIDLVEIRLDCLADHSALLSKSLPRISRPLLLTARHPREGGSPGLGLHFRHDALLEFLPLASAIDIELRSVPSMRDIIEAARKGRKTLVFSFHDFCGTPSIQKLRGRVAAARHAGADIVKIATKLRSPRDLVKLLLLQSSSAQTPLATMGMGALGRVSRLALAAAGSRLNYGYIDCPQVDGQWDARDLAAMIREVGP